MSSESLSHSDSLSQSEELDIVQPIEPTNNDPSSSGIESKVIAYSNITDVEKASNQIKTWTLYKINTILSSNLSSSFISNPAKYDPKSSSPSPLFKLEVGYEKTFIEPQDPNSDRFQDATEYIVTRRYSQFLYLFNSLQDLPGFLLPVFPEKDTFSTSIGTVNYRILLFVNFINELKNRIIESELKSSTEEEMGDVDLLYASTLRVIKKRLVPFLTLSFEEYEVYMKTHPLRKAVIPKSNKSFFSSFSSPVTAIDLGAERELMESLEVSESLKALKKYKERFAKTANSAESLSEDVIGLADSISSFYYRLDEIARDASNTDVYSNVQDVVKKYLEGGEDLDEGEEEVKVEKKESSVKCKKEILSLMNVLDGMTGVLKTVTEFGEIYKNIDLIGGKFASIKNRYDQLLKLEKDLNDIEISLSEYKQKDLKEKNPVYKKMIQDLTMLKELKSKFVVIFDNLIKKGITNINKKNIKEMKEIAYNCEEKLRIGLENNVTKIIEIVDSE